MTMMTMMTRMRAVMINIIASSASPVPAMMIVMIRMRTVMVVACSALPMGSNVTFEMHIRIRTRMR